MVSIKVLYEGHLHTMITHTETGQTLHTDAPKDHHGEGKTFSPTDLLGASLASCIATLMAMQAQKEKLDLTSMSIDLTKTMTSQGPRRIANLVLKIHMPVQLGKEVMERLERAAKNCPVWLSLHPDIQKEITFLGPEDHPPKE